MLTEGSSDQPEVSDGQQRLATSTILLAAIRDYFLDLKDEELAASIESDFLFTYDREARSKVSKLTLNTDDRQFFLDTVLRRPSEVERKNTQPKKDSHQKIATASRLAVNHIQLILKPIKAEHSIDTLNRWIKFVQDRAQVILLRVPDDIDAYQMFETLNGRGLKTSQADLLKNYLFKRVGAKGLPTAQSKWGAMTGALDSLDEEEIAVTYLRHLLQTMHGPTKAREVLVKVKSEITSPPKAASFLEMLADSAGDYVAMLNSIHPKWQQYGESTSRSIETIHMHLHVEQIRPLMFAVTKYFSPKETDKAFRLFVAWSVRFLIVGGRGGLLDRHYALRSQEVGAGNITTAKELAKAMEDVVPSDGTFQAAFADARVSQSNLARYYLRSLEMTVTGQPEPELVPNEDSSIMTLEHVLPENPDGNWPGVDPSDAEAYYKRIGNMALLQASKNVTVGNLPFAVKKPILAKSAYILTKEVGKKPTWGPKEIRERQKRLADLAIKTWPLTVH